MSYELKKLFYTPLWEFNLENQRELNRKLLIDGMQQFPDNVDFFDLPGEGIADLKRQVLDSVKLIANENDWPTENIITRCSSNTVKQNQFDSAHFHYEADLIGVYYVYVRDKCGDILLNDVRGHVASIWQSEKNSNRGKSSRAFHRITPKAGKLILFPNYVVHSVEPNYSDDNRVSIIFDFKFRNSKEQTIYNEPV